MRCTVLPMFRRITYISILCLLLLSFPVRSYCQDRNPADMMIEQYAPTPKALEQIRAGLLPVDLSSGSLSMDIPVGAYEDADFTIPVSLHYSTGGLKPASPSGEAGLGWTLMAGGSITREIVGIDDFFTGGFYYADHISASSVYNMTESVALFDNRLPSLDNGNHETTSDIYHFSFPGHSGSFVIANDGTFTAYDTSGDRGTYSISYNDSGEYFTIQTSDGMTWRFGSTETNREVMLRQNGIMETQGRTLSKPSGELPPVTWLLDRITAPNGRVAEFTYVSSRTSYQSIPIEGQDIITTFSRSLNHVSGMTDRYKEASLVCTSYLSNIDVRDSAGGTAKRVADFSWERKNYKEIAGTEPFDYTKMIVKTRRLTGITLKEGNTTLRTATLTYDDSRGRPLLTGVTIPVYGTWTMTYNLPSGSTALPGQLSNAVDYWGYYNGQTGNQDTMIWPTDVGLITYDESLNTTAMDPNSTYSVLGTLKKVTWPSGGSTSITYESNRASKILLRRKIPVVAPLPDPDCPALPPGETVSSAYLPSLFPVSSILHSDECGGVRVKTVVEDSVTDGTFTRSYSYTDASGHSTGIVQDFNRYFGGKVGGYSVWNPNLRFPGNGFDQRHIAYTSVVETNPDGSYERTDFSSWEDTPDLYSTCRRVYTSQNFGNGEEYDIFIDNILREGESLTFRRGLPLRSRLYSGGRIVRDRVYTYEDSGSDYYAYVVGSGHYWWSSRRLLHDRVRATVTTTLYPSSNHPLTTSESFTYDSYGRRLSVEDTDSDGTRRKATTAYLSTTLQPSLPSSVTNRIRPSGSSAWTTTESTAYSYVQSGTMWNLTSGVRTLYPASGGSGTVADNVTYSAHNAQGRPCQLGVNGDVSAVVWGYGGRYPVAVVDNCSYSSLPSSLQSILPGGLSDAQKKTLYELTGVAVRVFDFDPSVGVTLEIAPSGRSLSYAYDTWGRLTDIEDSYGTSLRSFSYGTINYGSGGKVLRQMTGTTALGASASRSERVVYDGLGRGWMNVVEKEGSVNPTHLVSLTKRDGLDRVTAAYLPYSSDTIGPSMAYNNQSNYWRINTFQEGGTYAKTLMSYSGGPLAWKTSETAPGKAIQTAGKSLTIGRSTNGADEVPRVVFNASNSSVSVSGYHPAGTLLRTETTSPDGETVITFETAEGRPVLTRVTDGTDILDTYTVSDLHDRTAWVITPLLGSTVRSAASGAGMTLSASDTQAGAGCYIYTYDSKGNLTRVKRPGAGYESAVFNSAHRATSESPIHLQSESETGSLYIANSYDGLGRKTAATLMRMDPLAPAPLDPLSRGDDTDAAGGGDRTAPEDVTVHTLSSYTYAESTSVDCIDTDTPGTPYASIPSALAFVSRSGIVSAPDTHVTGELLTETHYPLLTPVTPKTNAASFFTWKIGDGMVGDTPAKTAYYYDGKGRVVQSVTQWPDGGITRISRSYDLEGSVLSELEEHRPAGAAASMTDWLWTENSYDTRGHLLTSSMWVGRGATPAKASATVTLSSTCSWDAIGRISGKTLSSSGHTVSTSCYHTMQGWLSVNNSSVDGVSQFSESIRYWDPVKDTLAARYGGKISEVSTSHSGYTSRAETYAYDGLGRLSHTRSYMGTATTPGTVNVEEMTYDAAGNISTLVRKGLSGTATAQYTMTRSGNRLTGVSDAVSGSSWTNQYSEDGSLLKDGRTGYYYADNLLGNLAQVSVKGQYQNYTVLATYEYLPDGVKLQASLSGGDTVLYRGSFTYRKTSGGGTSLESVALPGGRVMVSGSTWTPYAYVSDHLGGTRAVVDLSSGSVVERSDYYPYGTRIGQCSSSDTAYPQLTANRWRYSGKEEQASVSGLPFLDFGARQYDPALGSWLTQDPLAKDYPSLSPYAYCAGDPVNLVDPEGLYFTDNSYYYVHLIQSFAISQINYWQTQQRIVENQLMNLDGSDIEAYASLSTRLFKIKSFISEYQDSLTELAKMEDSNQGYNIIISDQYNDPSNSSLIRGGSKYNENTDLFDMVVPTIHIGLIAHELKHGYQFEIGEFSNIASLHLYDKEDEYEAYQRQFFFSGQWFSRDEINSMEQYENVPTRLVVNPINDFSLKKAIESAIKGKSAFRYKGVTYNKHSVIK
ncbi:MAG: RHS repeat-associated core domain-containing protein [Bacteroidales bacterium]|nr:RHS repeat-associated core domain-containing protein [Bacteroidales bacterium]